MPRYTPLYGLPALDPSDKLRTIADTDWANAQTVEQILQNQGQPPLASDLVSLVKRLNALEAPTPYFHAANINAPSQATGSGWQQINTAVVQQVNVGGFTFAGGVVTVPSDGLYFVQAGYVVKPFNPGTRGLQCTLNSAAADKNLVFKNEGQGLGNVQSSPTPLTKGDQLRFFYSAASATQLGDFPGDTYFKVYRIGARA